VTIARRVPVLRNLVSDLPTTAFEKTVSEYEGAFYQVQHETVRLTQEYYTMERVEETKILKLYNRHYRTTKLGSVVKFLLQREIKQFLVWLYRHARESQPGRILVVPDDPLYRFLVRQVAFAHQVRWPIEFRGASGFGRAAWVRGVVKCWMHFGRMIARQGVCLRVDHVRSYPIGFRAHSPRREGLLRTDFLIDGGEITPDRVLFFLEDGTTAYGKAMCEVLRAGGYRYVVLNELRYPIRSLPRMVMECLWLPLWVGLRSLVSDGRAARVAPLLTSISYLMAVSRVDLLLDHCRFRVLFSFHSASYEPLISPILCQRRKCQFALYNFGITAFQAPYADYAFQNAHVFFSWGADIMNVYRETHHFDEIVNTGFWGFPEYRKALAEREKLRVALGVNPGKRVVVFYDIPYFTERSSFTAVALYDFYRAAIACANLDDTVVILKMKNRHNENLAIYPSALREGFQKVWQEIRSRPNMTSSVTLDWDPLQMIAVSDANASLELSTPSTIALLCGKAGFFFNTVEEYVYHPLFPKYKGQLIFDDMDALVEAIKRYLDRGDNGTPLVEPGDLDGYNAGGDEAGLERFRIETLKRTGLLRGWEPELARVANGTVVG
jgi:hypothetical protein